MVCGRLQRACLTFPPGAACLMSNLFSLMRGLTHPGSRRRVSSSVGADLSCAARLLRRNLGKGFFSFDRFRRAAPLFTDASKSSRYVGGGFFSHCGRFSFWRYGSSSSRKPIDELEGDTVVKAVRALGHLWRHSVVPIFIDNQAFQASAKKGWSKAPRLASSRFRATRAIDVCVNGLSFFSRFMFALPLFLLYRTDVSLLFVGNLKPFIFDFGTVPDCGHVRVCGFFCSCVLVRMP